MRVLILCPHYLPGFQSGGPVRSVSCLIEALGDHFEFFVLTHCHDAKLAEPYPGVPIREWVRVGKASVMYLRDEDFHPWRLARFVREARPDAVLLNSFFHRLATLNLLLLRRLGKLGSLPVALAPRGELAPGALQLKRTRKRLFPVAAKLVGLYRGVHWVASSDFEKAEIHDVMGDREPVAVFHIPPRWEDLAGSAGDDGARAPKRPGEADIACIGKVTPKKNLDFALDRLLNVRGNVRVSIVGRLSDSAFEAAIKRRIRALPAHVRVQLLGQQTPAEAMAILQKSHLHLFPTRGENFGHVIVESLATGCPVLLSDRTPWRDLQAEGVGWDLPLDRPEAFEAALQSVLDLDDAGWRALSKRARSYAERICTDPQPVQRAREFFASLCRPSGSAEAKQEEVQAPKR
ncbi:MAG: glycosyltransferase family 4 protein [Armatimonadetes bacterium]|nr:glycosyltransferase family 4 protein [Armatimonadota bacterium]